MKEKSIRERLVAKYRKTKKQWSRFDKNIELTPDEEKWIAEHEDELCGLLNEAESKHSSYRCLVATVVDGELLLSMGW